MQRKEQEEAAALAANMEATCGEPASHADHQVGERIKYRVSAHEERVGTILFIAAPQQIMASHIPLTYVCQADGAGDTFPDLVYAWDIIETPLWSHPAD